MWSAIYSWLVSPSPAAWAPPDSFPRFSELPSEIRIMIWEYSLESRVIPVHLHKERTDRNRQTMQITVCTGGDTRNLCSSFSFPDSKPGIASLHHVCRESRQVARRGSVMIFDSVYDDCGRSLHDPEQRRGAQGDGDELDREQPAVSSRFRGGVLMNPAIDGLLLSLNVASAQSVTDVHHFAAIAANEAPSIQRVMFRLRILKRPYHFTRGMSENWTRLGLDREWVPHDVVKFRNLKEVVLLIRNRGNTQKMLSAEWRAGIEASWRAQLQNMILDWPTEWEGNPPALGFQID